MSELSIKYTLNQLFAKALMEKRPLVVVEGADDRSFYLRLLENEGKKATVMASELVKKNDDSYYTPGCTGVIEIVEKVQEKFQKNPLSKYYFLGIIDSDYRKFTEESLNLSGLLVLKYYSYESHFVTTNSTKQLIAFTTRVSMQDIAEEITENIQKNTKTAMDDMYLAGLEMLYEKLNPSREKLFEMDTKPEALYQKGKDGAPALIDRVKEKKEELHQFATSKDIKRDDIYFVVKGKYLLYAFVKAAYEQIGNLKNLCKNNQISQCDYCQNGKFEHCIWKVKHQLKRSEYNSIMVDINWKTESELEYIKKRLSALG